MIKPMAVIPHAVLKALPVPVRVPRGAEMLAECGPYRVRLVTYDDDRNCLCRLRFLVFNLELNEGLDASYLDGTDHDQFDSVCEHLIVEHRESGRIVGTYRWPTGEVARKNFGYLSVSVSAGDRVRCVHYRGPHWLHHPAWKRCSGRRILGRDDVFSPPAEVAVEVRYASNR